MRELCLANPFGIVSSEQLNDDLTAKDTFRTATYGTGPYMYEGDNDGQTWNFVRNPNYWGETPEVDSFSIKSIPDNDAKILALKNGEVDFISGIKMFLLKVMTKSARPKALEHKSMIRLCRLTMWDIT